MNTQKVFQCAVISLVLSVPVSKTAADERDAAKYNVLASCYIVGAPPAAEPMTLAEYNSLRAEYSVEKKRYTKEADSWRAYQLALVSFDKSKANIGILTQFESQSWNWVKQFELQRNREVDKGLGITQILMERAKVVGGVKYGMTIAEVTQLKGQHFKVKHHADIGSTDMVYDDVTVIVRGWEGGEKSQVVRVEATTEWRKGRMKDFAYEDEKKKEKNTEPAVPAKTAAPHR